MPPHPFPRLHYGYLFYALCEVVFSFYHAYLVTKVQQPGPPPNFSKKLLRTVLIRALETGMDDEDEDEDVNADISGTISRAESMERLGGSETTSGSSDVKALGSGSTSPIPLSGTPSRAPSPIAGHSRLRASSVLPSFAVARPLDKDDVRARRFRDELAMWFIDARPEDVTARAVERWLAWSLYAKELEEVEVEAENSRVIREQHASATLRRGLPRLSSGATVAAAVDNVMPPTPTISPPPSPLPPSHESFPPSPMPGREDFGDEAVEAARTAAEYAAGWSKPGARLEFLLWCREMFEARQGFEFPRRATSWNESVGEDEESIKNAPHARAMRLTIDPVRVQSRPLACYLFANALSRFTVMRAESNGFSLEQEGRLRYLVRRPPRWTRQLAEARDARTASLHRPIIFLHGLGIGLGQYSTLINQLATSHLASTHPILVPLFPATSQDIFDVNFLNPVGHHEMTATLRVIIQKEHWHRCGITILSHSMGTIVGSWLVKSLGALVRRMCIVDPVCFSLWVPVVIGNFLYNKPDTPVRHLMRYFVGTELGTAHALSRHFNWASNILWPREEIQNLLSPHHTRIYLSEQDAILDAKANRRYLRSFGMKDASEGGGLTMARGAAHGEVLMAGGTHMRDILAWLDEPDA
ncbi:hypothetical protein IE81DRAFT_291303 [Ceraceosorus guamensis]|uniref:AB hydrolase-1 domain-containing protein n=1 Tax=Ceraceosorus guamensis TaxID=1522189 RepID=A0A316VWK8_9BASI|nr:hypothetical protein IE81DRAFT_291303 [Ceraceosorus guamensis]PWN41832.1 hypothetical protein IE81DRAFT_291303 [Ceraceosorus guamensis]